MLYRVKPLQPAPLIQPEMSRSLLRARFLYDAPFLTAASISNPFRGHGCSHIQIFKMHKDHFTVPPIRKINYAFSSCSISKDLLSKRCVPCNSKDIRPMSEEAANGLLQQVEGWNISSEDGTMKLHRSWKVKSFTKGLEFFQLIADLAEAEGHHPDLHLVGWNNVKIDIWTHSVGGLTENDFILAAKINSLKLEHLLRKKAAAT